MRENRPPFGACSDTGGKGALCNNGTTAHGHMNFDDEYMEKNTTQGSYKKLQPFFKDFSRTFQGPH